MDMEGVNFVTCPRCTMHIVFVQGEGRPPAACPHCGLKMEGFRQADCAGCGGRFETAAPAGSGLSCPHCGARGVAPAGAGETATERRNIPARLRGETAGAPQAGSAAGRDPDAVRRRRIAVVLWGAGTPTAALGAAMLVLVVHRALFPTADRFDASALPAAGIAGAIAAIAWAAAAWRSTK
ncbi:MAG: zinc ribbon domain-containing protein [Planctomycetes bacterium]|nr:zinc ribbon domain-containing protein [Planctomycetota bacterium]